MAQTQIGRAANRAWWSVVLRGALAIILGIFIVVRPLESVAAVALVIALWALMQGLVRIVHAFELRPVAAHWWLLLLSGIVDAGFGIAALYYYPGLSLSYMVVWTSLWLLIGGVAGVAIAIQERRVGLPWGWTMAWGALGVAASIFAFMNPPATVAALMALLASFAIVSGVALVIGAFRLRSAVDSVSSTVRGAYST